jgi:hypothetical protein
MTRRVLLLAAATFLCATVTAIAAPALPKSGAARARVPAPYSTVTSADGRWLAANWRMKQEALGAFLLFDRGELVRSEVGFMAVGFEPGTSRLLVNETVGDDDTHFWFFDLAKADDGDYHPLPRTDVHRSMGWTLESWKDGRLVFLSAYEPALRETVVTASVR